MSWDYSIYPELTDAQKKCFKLSGETLYMIQMAENAIKICATYIFNGDKEFKLDQLFSYEEKVRHKTLGYLLNKVKHSADVHSDFELILNDFLRDRNFFVHEIFADTNYSLATGDNCTRTEEFLLKLQDYAWNVQNVFLGCFLNWTKENGIYEHFPENIKNNSHLNQVEQKPFEKLFEKNNEISVVWESSKPNKSETS